MNKKGQFVAILSLFLVLGLVWVYIYLDRGTAEVVRMYYTPADVLDLNFEIKEYEFGLNQEVKYSSFKAFSDLSEKSNFIEKNLLSEDFKKYFEKYFGDSFDVKVEVAEDKFKISGKYKESIVFERFKAKVDFKPEFSYVLDYDLKIFEELYTNCKNNFSCDDLKQCKINKSSSGKNYIKMEKNLESNGFIEPKIIFENRFKKLEG